MHIYLTDDAVVAAFTAAALALIRLISVLQEYETLHAAKSGREIPVAHWMLAGSLWMLAGSSFLIAVAALGYLRALRALMRRRRMAELHRAQTWLRALWIAFALLGPLILWTMLMVGGRMGSH